MELVGPGRPEVSEVDISSTPPANTVTGNLKLQGKKRKSESAASSISNEPESAGATAKKSKMMTSKESDEANQPVQKMSVSRPGPRPLAAVKKANSEANQPVQKKTSVQRPQPVVNMANTEGESLTVVSRNTLNAQETMSDSDQGNYYRKRSNPAGNEDENGTDLATPVRPAKKVKVSAQTAKPLRRTGNYFICSSKTWAPGH